MEKNAHDVGVVKELCHSILCTRVITSQMEVEPGWCMVKFTPPRLDLNDLQNLTEISVDSISMGKLFFL